MGGTHFFALLVAMILGYRLYFNHSTGREILADWPAVEYDYVIVGGGSAGSVLASRLSEDRANTVLLLEAGGFWDKSPELHSPMEWLPLLKSEHAWDYYTEPQTHSGQGMNGKRHFWPRGRILGGTSMLNAMHYIRGSPYDFDEWAASGCSGWSYKDVLPYFLKSEDIQIPELKSSPYHSSGGPLAVSGGQITQLGSLYITAGQEMGYKKTDCNSEVVGGFCEVQLTVRNGFRSSTGIEFLCGTADRKNLDIVLESFVTKVDIQNNVAVGVTFIKDNRKHSVRARKEVILSAGAISTPKILMLSGIGPKSHLSEIGIPVIADLPVGENLQDHQLVFLWNKISKPLGLTSALRDSWWTFLQYKLFGTGIKAANGNEVTAFLHTDNTKVDKTHPDLLLFFGSYLTGNEMGHLYNFEESVSKQLLSDSSSDHGFLTLVTNTRPKSKGTIKLRSKDPFDHPVIDPRYFTDSRDIKTTINGIRIWEKMLETKTMQELGVTIDNMKLPFCSQHDFQFDEYWECFIRHTASTVYHGSGTCKMGARSDPTAVVDSELRVKGIKGLRVVDTSVFPNITSGTTNAPVIMAAEKAADLIRGKDTVSQWRSKFSKQ